MRDAEKISGRPSEKFEGLYLVWIRADKICIPVSSPAAAMTLVGPMVDKVTYIAYVV